jgi:ATP-dependent RNA helicase DbpA
MNDTVSFSSLPLAPDLLAVTAELGFEKLTSIQAQAIPVLLEGKDLIGQSKTGSGKTAAFSLPILQKISGNLGFRDVQALILCPTRELCTQVARDIRRLGRRLPGLQVLIVSGGTPSRPQRDALRLGVHIVVGTPGRTLDLISRGDLFLGNIATLVLDEADRMLDMGFEDEMSEIMQAAPENRQTVFFSATFPDSIQGMSKRYQKAPKHIVVTEEASEKPDIQQLVVDSTSEDKLADVLAVLQQFKPQSAIIFCNLKVTVAEMAERLAKQGVDSSALHGDLEQEDRDKVMAMFRNGSIRVLVATDVAARGLDVADLDLVINCELPLHMDDYVHRIGRTGRAGKSGIAITLATARERLRLADFERESGGKVELLKVNRSENLPYLQLEASRQTVLISGGRKDKVRPGDILGALTGETGRLNASDIGKIEIHDRYSYVGISRAAAPEVHKLKSGKIKGRLFMIRLLR